MVNNSDKISVLKPIFSLIIIFTIIGTSIFIYQFRLNNNILKPTSASVSNTTLVINSFNLPKKELPTDLFFDGYLKDSTLIGSKKDCKNIYSHNINAGSTNIVANVYDSNNFIKTIVCNSQWIVWVENEVLIEDTSSKAFKWQIIALNVATNKKTVIDKSSFINNKYEVPMFINYTPDKLAIYNNSLVYCKTQPDNLKIKTELVEYDLKSNTKNIISSTNDVMNEMIADCNIYENKIVWSTFKELNKNYKERLTQYKFSDLYIYELNTKKTQQITSNNFFHNPSIFKDKIAAIQIPLKLPNVSACNSEVVMINLNSKKIQTIVNENSPCYNEIEDELYRCNPKLNDKYLSWQNNTFSSSYIYNYNTNKFINLLEIDSNPSNTNRIYNLFDNYALMYKTSDEEKNDKNICIFLNSIDN